MTATIEPSPEPPRRGRATALGPGLLAGAAGVLALAGLDRAEEALPRVPGGALALGFAVVVGELLALPLIGATPPLRRWSPLERALLPLHVGAFVAVARAALGAARLPGRPVVRASPALA